MARLGFRTVDEMIGRSDRLEMRPALDHWKARGLDFSRILAVPDVPGSYEGRRTKAQEHGVELSLDATTLLELCRPALTEGLPVRAELPIRNVNRATGTMLGSEITRHWGRAGLPDDTISLTFRGSAGQSFGAFIPRGLTLRLEGDTNDYVGKGLSGGRIIVAPPEARRSSPTRTSSPATSPCTGPPAARPSSGASPASASPSATRAPPRWSRASATTAAST